MLLPLNPSFLASAGLSAFLAAGSVPGAALQPDRQEHVVTTRCVEPGTTLDLLRAGWAYETHQKGRVISDVRQTASGALVMEIDFRPGDEKGEQAYRAGEAFFELENFPCIRGPVDLNGAEIDMEYQVDKVLLNGPTHFGQIFVETENSDGETGKQYSLPRPTDYRRNRLRFRPDMLKALGYTDAGLDLAKTVAIGFRLSLGKRESKDYSGAVELTRATLTLPSAEKRAEIENRVRERKTYEKDEDSRISETCRETGLPEDTRPWGGPDDQRLEGDWVASEHVVIGPRVEVPGTATKVRQVRVRFDGLTDTVSGRTAEARYVLKKSLDASGKRVKIRVAVDKALRGNLARPNWVHAALEDSAENTMAGPGIIVSERACQWREIEILPTVDTPMPLGNVEDGFDMRGVKAIWVKFELGRFWSEIYGLESVDPERLEGWFHVSDVLLEDAAGEYVPKRHVLGPLASCEATGHPLSREEFTVGVNYPWIHYGWDVGRNPSGERTSCGFSTHGVRLREDFRILSAAGVDLLRVFVFGDLRTGVVFDENGYALDLDACVRRDMKELFSTASEFGLRLMLALLDYKSADGIEVRQRGRMIAEDEGKGDWKEGEHPGVIVDASRRAAFLDRAVRPFLGALRDLDEQYGNLHSLDIANELGNARAVVSPALFPDVKRFVAAVASLARQELPGTTLSLGTRSMPDLVRFWRDAPVDLRQFHYYDSFPEEGLPDLARPAACLGFDEPVLIGEIDPTGDLYGKLETVYRNGYAGALFWSFQGRDGYGVDLSAIRRWKEGR